MADGTLLFNTKIDTEGFNNGTSTISSSLGGFQNSLKGIGKAAIAAFTIKNIIKFGKEAVNIASNLEEVQNVVDVAFGSMKYKIEEFSKIAIKSYGISELTAKRTASTYMAMATGMGIARNVGSDLAIELTKLSADMASFYNISQERADIALKAVFTGETEVLKQYGIVMTEVNLKQFALSLGIKKSLDKMTQQEKTMLRYQFVMKQTSLAQGDFARTSDSWANQTRLLSENWKEFMGIIGEALIKVLTPLVKILNKIVEGLINVANFIRGAQDESEDNAGLIEDMTDAQDEYTESIAGTNKELRKELASFDTVEKLFNNTVDGIGGGTGGLFDFSDLDKLKQVGDSVPEEKEKVKLIWEWEPTFPNIFETPVNLVWSWIPKLPTLINVWADIGWKWVPKEVKLPNFEPLPNPIYNPNWNLQDTFYLELLPLKQMLLDNLPVLLDPMYKPNWNLKTTFENELDLITEKLNRWKPIFTANFESTMQNLVDNSFIGLSAINQNFAEMFKVTNENIINWAKALSENNKLTFENLVDNGVKGIKTFVRNFVDGLKSAWENFKNWAISVGQAISRAYTETPFIQNTTKAGLVLIGAGLAIPTFGSSLIPAAAALAPVGLANGTVVPPNRKFTAILGDNKRETEIVSPLSTMKQALVEALSESGQNITIKFEETSIGDLVRVLKPYIDRENRRIGNSTRVTGGAY